MKLDVAIAVSAMVAGLASPALAQEHAADLVREDTSNGIAFTARYTGRSMVVDDYVVASTASPGGHGSISIGAKPDKYGFPPSALVMCVLGDAQEIQKFGALNKGAHIVLTGTFSVVQGSTIVLKDCSYAMAASK